VTSVSRIADRITGRYERAVAGARDRYSLVDHAFRMTERYGEAFGGRLAAAIAYYGFFAVFALGVVGYSALGFLLDHNVDLEGAVDEFLRENVPVVELQQISAGRGAAGIFGLIGLVFAGVAWVEALRSSQRRIWELEQAPGNPIQRRAIDIPVLAGLAVLLGASIAVATGVEELLLGVPVLEHLGWLLMIGVNLLAVIALLAALPRLRISPGRLMPPAVVVAVGIFALNSLGGIFVAHVRANPAYAVVAYAAGLLVYLYLFHQLVLLGAAWAATADHGRVVDLAAGSPPPDEEEASSAS
jgi:membrane protein